MDGRVEKAHQLRRAGPLQLLIRLSGWYHYGASAPRQIEEGIAQDALYNCRDGLWIPGKGSEEA